MRGINAELITEFAKDKTYEENLEALKNQVYMFGNQYFRISRCEGKVDVIVTDSPLLLSLIYNKNPILDENFENVVKKISNYYSNQKNYYIKRVSQYENSGRIHTEKESNEIADKILNMLQTENIEFKVINGDKQGYNEILNEIFKEENYGKLAF